MKVRDLKATLVAVPLERGEVALGSADQRDKLRTIIVTIETDDGITGEIYSGNSANGMSMPFHEIRDLVLGPCKDVVMGEDPFAVERIWERLSQATSQVNNREAAMRAVAAVDMALWDVMGKALKMPLYRLLGGHKNEIPAMGDGGSLREGRDLEDIVGSIARQKELGYGGTKFHVEGTSTEADIKQVEAVRKAAGDDFIVALDAGKACTPEQAIRFSKSVEKYNIAWFEEPVPFDDIEGMRRVREATTIPVTAGQSELTGPGCMELLKGGAVDYLNAESSKLGGITEWRRVAAAAHFFGVRMIHHKECQVSIQLLSALPHTFCAEFFQDPERDPFWHHMNLGRPEIKDGKIMLSDEPGLGIRIDQGFVSRYRET